jgi:hypothetical protein
MPVLTHGRSPPGSEMISFRLPSRRYVTEWAVTALNGRRTCESSRT